MSTSSVYCHILGGNISVVSDLNGNIKNIVFPQFSRVTHGCLLKSGNTGFASRTLLKILDKASGTRANYCEFADPNEPPITKFMRG